MENLFELITRVIGVAFGLIVFGSLIKIALMVTFQDGQFTAFRVTGERIDLELYTAQSIILGN